ncbi:hypothetical protein DICVIV_10010 [Dictyocaulus viviparus]|uniref:Proteolipid membrane potential modulator n=1 Tax=Dictyocaulus viviparus TaxID=29172 RepID=A0A0D8XH28_DICVI|nr:hypothetical protein DICVIV_10010 [Dictyocaulus viviparus]
MAGTALLSSYHCKSSYNQATRPITSLYQGLIGVLDLHRPLAVLIDDGCTAQLCINILLLPFGIIPAIIHAYWVILCRDGRHRYR